MLTVFLKVKSHKIRDFGIYSIALYNWLFTAETIFQRDMQITKEVEYGRDFCPWYILACKCATLIFTCREYSYTTRNTCLQQPLAVFPNIVTFQHEVFRIISTLNAGSLCLHHVYHGNTINVFLIFWTKQHKIVEILALLTIELSRCCKIFKVGRLFCIVCMALILCKF